MHEGIVALFIPITISLGVFLMIWGIRYLENKENMAMIEKGMEPVRRRRRLRAGGKCPRGRGKHPQDQRRQRVPLQGRPARLRSDLSSRRHHHRTPRRGAGDALAAARFVRAGNAEERREHLKLR